TAKRLERIHVPRVELRTETGEVAVWNGYAVNFPRHPVSTARMQVIVHDEGAGNIVGNHRQTAGAIGLRLPRNLVLIRLCLGRGRFRIDQLRGDLYGRLESADGQLQLNRRDRVRGDDDFSLAVRKSLDVRGNDVS